VMIGFDPERLELMLAKCLKETWPTITAKSL
jgi:hypothetical protein